MNKPSSKRYRCEDCKHFCEVYEKGKSFLPTRVFCYCDGKRTSKKSLACELFSAKGAQ